MVGLIISKKGMIFFGIIAVLIVGILVLPIFFPLDFFSGVNDEDPQVPEDPEDPEDPEEPQNTDGLYAYNLTLDFSSMVVKNYTTNETSDFTNLEIDYFRIRVMRASLEDLMYGTNPDYTYDIEFEAFGTQTIEIDDINETVFFQFYETENLVIWGDLYIIFEWNGTYEIIIDPEDGIVELTPGENIIEIQDIYIDRGGDASYGFVNLNDETNRLDVDIESFISS